MSDFNLSFQEIFNEEGMYVGEDFGVGHAFVITKEGFLNIRTYTNKNDLFPIDTHPVVYKTLFNKKFKKVYTRQSLFN